MAGLLGAPVVLVVDCRGQSRSVAALLHGFRSFDPAVRVAGVVLNRVGSDRHEAVLRAACDEVGLAVLGALPRRAELAVPSRHLGLVTAAEHGSAATAAVDGHGRAGGGARRPGRGAPPGRADPARPGLGRAAEPPKAVAPDGANAARPPGRHARPVVAVAGGAAFTFGYAEHTELLEAAGREVAVVDPLHDEALPAGTSALVLPGGFPEEHVAALSANAPLRAAVADARGARAHPCTPSAAGCSTCARAWTGRPCAGSCPPRRR